jgi:hypothetical protein
MTTPRLLWEHPQTAVLRRGYRAECGVCGSYWDLDSLASRVDYDASYPEQRGHFDPRVGALKVRTLRRWLQTTGVTLSGKTVCEVGFGGGSCLPFLSEGASHLIGLEVNQSAIDRVRAVGTRAELLRVDPLPSPSRPIDLWLFQDSFEHIPEPGPFVDWMKAHSAPTAQILIVLPRGDATSRRMMGRMWPHKLPDHQFHWSRAGLVDFMNKRGFALRRDFFPLKFVSPQMAVAHALHKFGADESVRRWLGGTAFAVPFNFGELGAVFEASPTT